MAMHDEFNASKCLLHLYNVEYIIISCFFKQIECKVMSATSLKKQNYFDNG